MMSAMSTDGRWVEFFFGLANCSLPVERRARHDNTMLNITGLMKVYPAFLMRYCDLIDISEVAGALF